MYQDFTRQTRLPVRGQTAPVSPLLHGEARLRTGETDERVNDRPEAPALRGQRVLDPGWPRVNDTALENARLLEFDEAQRKRPRRNLTHGLLELVET